MVRAYPSACLRSADTVGGDYVFLYSELWLIAKDICNMFELQNHG